MSTQKNKSKNSDNIEEKKVQNKGEKKLSDLLQERRNNSVVVPKIENIGTSLNKLLKKRERKEIKSK